MKCVDCMKFITTTISDKERLREYLQNENFLTCEGKILKAFKSRGWVKLTWCKDWRAFNLAYISGYAANGDVAKEGCSGFDDADK